MCTTVMPCGAGINGDCVVSDGVAVCRCYDRWTGQDCDTPVEGAAEGLSTGSPLHCLQGRGGFRGWILGVLTPSPPPLVDHIY